MGWRANRGGFKEAPSPLLLGLPQLPSSHHKRSLTRGDVLEVSIGKYWDASDVSLRGSV